MRKHGGTPSRRDKHVTLAATSPPSQTSAYARESFNSHFALVQADPYHADPLLQSFTVFALLPAHGVTD